MRIVKVLLVLLFAVAPAARAQIAGASLAITPNPATVVVGGRQQFTATLTINGVAVPATIRWSLQGARKPGVSWGTVTRNGLYTAPAQIPPAYLGWPAGYVRVIAWVQGKWVPVRALADVYITAAATAPSPTLTRARRMFFDLACFPDDLAWHGDTLWGVNLILVGAPTGPDCRFQAAERPGEEGSVSEIDIAAVNAAVARGATLPLRIGPYERRHFTRIARRNTACGAAQSVTGLDPQSLTALGPTGLTSDGGALWLATYGPVRPATSRPATPRTPRIWRVIPDAVDPACLRELASFDYRPLGAENGGPRGLAWDWERRRLWVADDVHGRVYELNPQNGTVVSFFDSPSSPGRPRGQPTGLAFDGVNLRLATYQDARHWTLTRAGAVVAETASPGTGPVGLTWENGRLWSDDDWIHEIHVR